MSFLCLLFVACEKETHINDPSSTSKGIINRNSDHQFSYRKPYQKTDVNFANLTTVVNDLIQKNPAFRNLIKNQSLLQFDGDYNVLLETLSPLSFFDADVNGQTIQTVESLINDAYNQHNFVVNTDQVPSRYMRDYPRDGGAVKQLIYLYPSLQFAVPVHIDNWDSQFIPPVTFIPENYDEHLNQSITAFKGAKKLNILTTSEPSFPVIVIGLNERIGKGVRSTEPPILDITLKGDDFESGIRLEWDFNSFENEIDGYHIFRKEAGQQNFVHIGENPTLENKIFNDVSVTANKSYSYYVRAFNNFGMSMASNIVTITAPDYPATAASFSATHFEIDYNELRWVHLPANYVETTRLSRRIVDVENDYSVIYEAAPEEESYIDNIDAYGKTVLYKLEEITNIGESSPKFDIVKLPYRNIAEPSALILSTYSYLDVNELEHWIYGKPEFAITAVRAGSDGEIEVVEKRLEIYFKNRRQKNDVYDFAPDSNSEPHTTYIADWYPTDFWDTYTINIVEFDNAPKIDLTLSASYEYKDTVATGFTGFVQGSVKTTIEDILNSRDEEIGKAEVRYYDPTNHILKYGQNEFQIQIRD